MTEQRLAHRRAMREEGLEQAHERARQEAREETDWKRERDGREAQTREVREPVRSERGFETQQLAARRWVRNSEVHPERGRPKEETETLQPRVVRESVPPADRASRKDKAPSPDEEEDSPSPGSAETPLAPADELSPVTDPATDMDAERGALSRGAMPLPLRGSLALLERQDERLEADGLERIEDEDDLSARIAHHLLVPVPVSDALTVNAELPLHHRYCRPWTARFLADLARAHEAEFHRPLEVSSAVRTVAYQARLMRINGNAAPAVGDIFSPHLMGATIDIAKKEMSRDEIAWMRRRLLALELAGKIDVEEEFEQACFHITVYKSYGPARTTRPQRKPENANRIDTAGNGEADPGGQ